MLSKEELTKAVKELDIILGSEGGTEVSGHPVYLSAISLKSAFLVASQIPQNSPDYIQLLESANKVISGITALRSDRREEKMVNVFASTVATTLEPIFQDILLSQVGWEF